MQEKFIEWLRNENNVIENNDTKVLGNNVLIEMYAYDHASKNSLIDLDNNLLSEKYGKEVFNVAKVLAVGDSYLGPIHQRNIVSLIDEFMEPIPDGSRGFTNEGEPKAGYIPLGRIVHYTYIKDKLSNGRQPLMFIVPQSIIAVIHENPLALCTTTPQEVESN